MPHMLASLLGTDITISAYLGETAEGPSWATPVAVRCKWDAITNRSVASSSGAVSGSVAEVIAVAKFQCAPEVTVAVESLVTKGAAVYEVVRVSPISGPYRAMYQIVEVGIR